MRSFLLCLPLRLNFLSKQLVETKEMQQGKPSRKQYRSALLSEKIAIEAPIGEKWVRGSKTKS